MTTEEQSQNQGNSISGRFRGYLNRKQWLEWAESPGQALLIYGILILYFSWLLVPIIWLGLSTIKTGDIIQASRLIIIPSIENFTLSNYREVLTNPQTLRLFRNSIIVTFSTVSLTLVVGILGAYSLSRFSYFGRQPLLISFLATKMLPTVLLIVPFFLMMFTYNIIDTYIGIILAHSIRALPLALWLLKGFFDDIPKALDESARIDGCSHLQILRHIILPLGLPGISVAAFYTFVTSWNDFLFVSILSRSIATRTIPFGLYLFQSQTSIDWGATITIATVAIIPSFILFALVQSKIIEGFASGGMHGE